MTPRFYYSVCQFGAEKTMKEDILYEFPHLRFAFSRPGFITFKEENGSKPAIIETQGIFARLFGVSVGQSKTPAELEQLIDSIPEGAIVHGFERDTFVPGDEPEGYRKNARLENELKGISHSLKLGGVPAVNQTVYDLIWIDEGRVFLGKHVHRPHLDTAPGNQPNITLPAKAPSRAYLKIEEAILRFQPKIVPGMKVLEVGCSPGGATIAMLARGLSVTGIDPKYMHESLSREREFSFVQKLAKVVTQEDLSKVNPDWLVLDMNLAPLEALDELQHVIQTLRGVYGRNLKLKTGFLTVKLNDWKFAENIPLYLKRIRELGFQDLTAMQLASNRQEFFVYAENFR
jgi:23S rRNA (cytidine2498-2'-O)-methyltransferase